MNNNDLPLVEDYRQLFLDDVQLMDVRAPVEFNEGAFPNAENHPLINDEERHQIGIKYKELGQDAAIDLGHELVKGKVKEERISEWHEFAEHYPDGVLYCFRGGMRSKITQQWLYENTGIRYPRVKGGYKALRRFLIDELETNTDKIRPVIIGGQTGVGKTILLNQIPNSIDLEDLAWHRGSAFGRHATEQPSQINFENALSIEILKHLASGDLPIVFEDESRHVGSRLVPENLHKKLKASPLVILEADMDQRVENTYQEYVVASLQEHLGLEGKESGFSLWCKSIMDSLGRIRKRLGGENYQIAHQLMESAIQENIENANPEAHKHWIEFLLINYYDPMYNYQLKNNKDRVVFKGNDNDVLKYILSDK